MLKTLDNVLLSEDVVKNFHDSYKNLEFKNWLINILPEIEDCKNTEQDNPWHVYNCLDHILHSVEEINKQTKQFEYGIRRMLAYTMLLHDIGKPECKIRRYSKLYKREVDSFFDHNRASVKIGERVLNELGFNQEEKDVVLKLVKNHDVFMSLTLEPTANQYKQMLTKDNLHLLIEHLDEDKGVILMRYLLMVGNADNMAQNPEMTEQSLKLIGVMEDMLYEVYGRELQN